MPEVFTMLVSPFVRPAVTGRVVLSAAVALLVALCPGCGGPGAPPGFGGGGMPDADRIMKQSELMQKLSSDPDLPTWYTARERITQSMGDRIFDKDFDRVFDSVTVALATLGANVNNMERQSGYITTAVPNLGPEREKRLQKQAAVDFCRFHKYDPSLLEKREGDVYGVDVFSMSGMNRFGQAMTISMVRQGKTQTKVKIRFSGVHYPQQLQDYYKTIWDAIDKQIFLDRGLD
jgi:hypothetical protein